MVLLKNLVLCTLAVIGDGGQVYVAPDVVPVYRSMLPLATIITPNYFEVELVYPQLLS
jgi:pyridoxine kinase